MLLSDPHISNFRDKHFFFLFSCILPVIARILILEARPGPTLSIWKKIGLAVPKTIRVRMSTRAIIIIDGARHQSPVVPPPSASLSSTRPTNIIRPGLIGDLLSRSPPRVEPSDDTSTRSDGRRGRPGHGAIFSPDRVSPLRHSKLGRRDFSTGSSRKF